MQPEDLESHVVECERKIASLEQRVQRLEGRLSAAIAVAARQATGNVIDRLREALSDED